jgi:hypothetical protein
MPGRAPDGIVCLSVSRRPLLRTRRPVKGERSRPVRPRRTGTRRAQDKKQRRVDFHDNLLLFSSSCSNSRLRVQTNNDQGSAQTSGASRTRLGAAPPLENAAAVPKNGDPRSIGGPSLGGKGAGWSGKGAVHRDRRRWSPSKGPCSHDRSPWSAIIGDRTADKGPWQDDQRPRWSEQRPRSTDQRPCWPSIATSSSRKSTLQAGQGALSRVQGPLTC